MVAEVAGDLEGMVHKWDETVRQLQSLVIFSIQHPVHRFSALARLHDATQRLHDATQSLHDGTQSLHDATRSPLHFNS